MRASPLPAWPVQYGNRVEELHVLKVLRFAGWSALAVVLLAAAVGAWRTFTVVDTAAVTAMNAAELAYLQRLRGLHRGMQVAEVVARLGQPGQTRESLRGTLLDGYAVPGEPLTHASIRFDERGAREITVIKLGHFTYRFTLEPAAEADQAERQGTAAGVLSR